MPINATTNIIDGTGTGGLTQEALAMWEVVVRAAEAAGLASINMNAGAGGGHLSHGHGTEIDVIGKNADGSNWTAEQRTMVAMAAAGVGANRFGLYSRNGAPTSMHLGLGYEGAPSNVVWGANGVTSQSRGDLSVNQFFPSEREFIRAVRAGEIAGYLASENVMAYTASAPPVLRGAALDAANAVAHGSPSLGAFVSNGGMVTAGMRGAAVEEMQRFLNDFGYTDANGNSLVEDGIAGRRTREAIMAFQADVGIQSDGVFGPDSLRAMQAQLVGVEISDIPLPTIRPNRMVMPTPVDTLGQRMLSRAQGSEGDDVEQLQRYLRDNGFTDRNGSPIEVDGIYGRRTEQAVEQLQRSLGVPIDGDFGPITNGELQARVSREAGQAAVANAIFHDPNAQPAEIVPYDATRNVQRVMGVPVNDPGVVNQPRPRPPAPAPGVDLEVQNAGWGVPFEELPRVRIGPDETPTRYRVTKANGAVPDPTVNVLEALGGTPYAVPAVLEGIPPIPRVRPEQAAAAMGITEQSFREYLRGLTWAEFRDFDLNLLDRDQLRIFGEENQRRRISAEIDVLTDPAAAAWRRRVENEVHWTPEQAVEHFRAAGNFDAVRTFSANRPNEYANLSWDEFKGLDVTRMDPIQYQSYQERLLRFQQEESELGSIGGGSASMARQMRAASEKKATAAPVVVAAPEEWVPKPAVSKPTIADSMATPSKPIKVATVAVASPPPKAPSKTPALQKVAAKTAPVQSSAPAVVVDQKKFGGATL